MAGSNAARGSGDARREFRQESALGAEDRHMRGDRAGFLPLDSPSPDLDADVELQEFTGEHLDEARQDEVEHGDEPRDDEGGAADERAVWQIMAILQQEQETEPAMVASIVGAPHATPTPPQPLQRRAGLAPSAPR